jgi:Tol biopolymer transport system component
VTAAAHDPETDLPAVRSNSMRTSIFAGTLVAAAAVLAFSAAPSTATFHGTNGRLVYRVQVGKHSQLFTVGADGTDARQITHLTDSDATWPAWSPDGARIAFERDFGSRAVIYTMSADGSDLRALRVAGISGEPSYSPDGSELTFGRFMPGKEASIWIMSASGSHLRRVTTNPLPKNDGCGGCAGQGSSVFSPDGKHIAFTWVKGAHSAAIYVVGTNGKSLHRLTPFGRGLADKIDWSPDGTRIAFASPEFGRPGQSVNVYTIRTDGTRLQQLTHERGGTVNDALDSWSPDGTQIAFVSNRAGGPPEVYAMNADGTNPTQLTRGRETHLAAWGSSR